MVNQSKWDNISSGTVIQMTCLLFLTVALMIGGFIFFGPIIGAPIWILVPTAGFTPWWLYVRAVLRERDLVSPASEGKDKFNDEKFNFDNKSDPRANAALTALFATAEKEGEKARRDAQAQAVAR